MERIMSQVWRYLSGRENASSQIHVNRIAQGGSQDRALANFKAEQARRAAKQDGAQFATNRAAK
mgnify:CR=1 FL=1